MAVSYMSTKKLEKNSSAEMGEGSPISEARQWYCIYTKANCEDSVCTKLGRLDGIELFNPKLKRRVYVNMKVREQVEELFPCYIFSKINIFEYCHLITFTRGVRRFVGSPSGSPSVVDESIIGFLQSRVKEGYVSFEPCKFHQGEEVAITAGPFGGLMGTLMEMKAQDRVMILLKAIQYQARVEVPRGLIARV